MIKRIKNLSPSALLSHDTYRGYIESFESETTRGIATLVVLKIILNSGSKGIYGYKILKQLKKETNDNLIIEEGRLYPLLRKLEHWGPKENMIQLVKSRQEKFEGGRIRNYYFITEQGRMLYGYLEGMFVTMLQSVATLFEYRMESTKNDIFFCPNCNNMIPDFGDSINFCEICGLNLADYKSSKKIHKEGMKNKNE